MRFILQYPEAQGSDLDLLDAGSVAEVARAAEEAGWHGIALTEHPAPSSAWLESGGHQSVDPFVALASAAGVTSTLALVTNLSVIPYRNPLLLAKSAATLNRVSEGRFFMGAGAGYLKSEFFALGVDFEERNALFEESLEVMRLHWSGEPFTFEGRHFSARNIRALPAPRSHAIPIWMGGNSDAALYAAPRARRRLDADDRAGRCRQDGSHAAGDQHRGAARAPHGARASRWRSLRRARADPELLFARHRRLRARPRASPSSAR